MTQPSLSGEGAQAHDWRHAWRHIRDDARVRRLFFFGYSSGLPLLLVFGTLSYWLREAGVDRATIGISGDLSGGGDVDWYQFTVTGQELRAFGHWGTIFDLDYADGLARPNTSIHVFDGNNDLVYTSRDSNIAEDRPGPYSGGPDLWLWTA